MRNKDVIGMIVSSIIVGLIVINLFRMFFKTSINKLIYNLFMLVCVISSIFRVENINFVVIVLLLSFITSYVSYRILGLVTFFLLAIILESIKFGFDKEILFYTSISAVIVYIFYTIYEKNAETQILFKEILLKKSKELNIIRKTSLLLQKTLEYDELIDILLNAITSKEGLNFDRVLLFFYDEDTNEFIPTYLKNSYDKTKTSFNIDSNEIYLDLKIVNSIINPFGKTFDTKEPLIIDVIDENDVIQKLINEKLNSTHFGLLPLIEKSKVKGIIFLDNNYTKNIIRYEELDNAVSIVNQASTALINSLLYSQSQNLAYTDSLTGLYNKRYLDLKFEQNFSKISAREIELAVLIIDVDYFKNYNDTNGHIEGNNVLKRLSLILLSESRNRDTVVRFGGEEFCILLFDIDKEGALAVAERMRARIEKEPFENGIKQPNGALTISVGATMFNGEDVFEKLLEKADKALYEAKALGRNRIVCYEGDEDV